MKHNFIWKKKFHLLKKWPFVYFVNMEHFCHTNTYHLKVSNTFSKCNRTVNQNTKSLTLTTTSFLKETCLIFFYHWPFVDDHETCGNKCVPLAYIPKTAKNDMKSFSGTSWFTIFHCSFPGSVKHISVFTFNMVQKDGKLSMELFKQTNLLIGWIGFV